ncbi:Peptidase s41 family protein [Emericellopsis cladophorae]|uniref:Peptidase s41 family protein n=1 Tax=Emericellopsis cladophorae TaxID=2686198 RepID=A0A9Q0BI43_9HYPO|nr:Peptidase s41 family protein [Emericellopsis cladophorae]KAI6785841.1 Peptidase s41 family protein [Emericellopsis cladophorae]
MVRLSSVSLVGSALVGMGSAAGAGSKEDYASGRVHHKIMDIKMSQWAEEEAAGLMDSSRYPELGYTPCVNGFAEAIPGDPSNTFRCSNVDLYHFLSHAELGSSASRGSSSWGWTSADGREFVAIGQYDGTAFAEISKEGKFVYLGRLPQYDSIGSNWREIRVVGDMVVIGSEAIKHGIQLFDFKKVLDLDPASPKTFTQEDLDGHWGLDKEDATGEPVPFWDYLPVGRTHNVVVNQELNYAIAVGSVGGNETIRVRDDLPCRGGLIFLDIDDPANVHSPGCAAGDGYVHDAECLVYRGPDERYYGRDICYGYNEDSVTIYDVTDKKGNTTNIISRIEYPGVEYSHQGVVNSEKWQEYLFLDDEFDERDAREGPESLSQGLPTTHIIDIRDLENPVWTGSFAGKTRSIDHNQYVVDGLLYQSNYGNGLNVYDITSVTEDPTGDSVCEVGFFDIHPEDDEFEGGGTVAFLGSWSSYAYFKSGFILVHTIERGSFIVKLSSKECPKAPKCNADNCLRAMRASHIDGRLEESMEFCGNFTQRLRTDEGLLPDYAAKACPENRGNEPIARVSSACACLPTEPVPELPRTTTRGPVPTVLPPRA